MTQEIRDNGHELTDAVKGFFQIARPDIVPPALDILVAKFAENLPHLFDAVFESRGTGKSYEEMPQYEQFKRGVDAMISWYEGYLRDT